MPVRVAQLTTHGSAKITHRGTVHQLATVSNVYHSTNTYLHTVRLTSVAFTALSECNVDTGRDRIGDGVVQVMKRIYDVVISTRKTITLSRPFAAKTHSEGEQPGRIL